MSAEKLGVTGGDGVNVNHEAHEVVGRPGFLRESRLNRFDYPTGVWVHCRVVAASVAIPVVS